MQHTMSMYANKDQMIEAMQAEIDSLKSELAELRKDSERLDWAGHPDRKISKLSSMVYAWIYGGLSLREAIDNAMKEVKNEQS